MSFITRKSDKRTSLAAFKVSADSAVLAMYIEKITGGTKDGCPPGGGPLVDYIRQNPNEC